MKGFLAYIGAFSKIPGNQEVIERLKQIHRISVSRFIMISSGAVGGSSFIKRCLSPSEVQRFLVKESVLCPRNISR